MRLKGRRVVRSLGGEVSDVEREQQRCHHEDGREFAKIIHGQQKRHDGMLGNFGGTK